MRRPRRTGCATALRDECEKEGATVLALAKGCPDLTTIDLSFCANITEKAKAALRESHEGITIYD